MHRFTLRGREENLWILNLVDDRILSEWEELEVGSLCMWDGVDPVRPEGDGPTVWHIVGGNDHPYVAVEGEFVGAGGEPHKDLVEAISGE